MKNVMNYVGQSHFAAS